MVVDIWWRVVVRVLREERIREGVGEWSVEVRVGIREPPRASMETEIM